MPETVISITSFDPLTIALPATPTSYTGDVFIRFPAVHLQIYDLSLGGLLPGAHIGADDQLFGLTLRLDANTMTGGQMVEFIQAASTELQAMHRIVQATLDEHGALLK
jgi:hypothetical protein